ncbi:hypothetical protein GCM10007159_29100 [Modicisalibacter luteus]|nr:hypothetical protein GCM10007159_29100 [Halomonas lutea]
MIAYFLIALIFACGMVGKDKLTSPLGLTLSGISIAFLVLLISSYNYIHLIYYVKFLGMIFYVYLFLILVNSKLLSKEDVLYAAKAFLYMHCTFFFTQLGIYLLTGNMINFDSYFREEDARLLANTLALQGQVIDVRATGIFSEPSFYSYTVYPVALVLSIYQGRYTLASILGIVTSVLTFSVAAFVIVGIGTIYTLFLFKKNHLAKIAIIIGVILFFPLGYTVFENRVINSVDYNAVESRMVIFEEFKQRGGIKNIFGSGFLWYEKQPIGDTGLRGYHTRDTSTFVYLFFAAGVLGTVLIILGIYLMFKQKIAYFNAFMVILLFKFSILSAAFWLALIFFCAFYKLALQEEDSNEWQGSFQIKSEA